MMHVPEETKRLWVSPQMRRFIYSCGGRLHIAFNSAAYFNPWLMIAYHRDNLLHEIARALNFYAFMEWLNNQIKKFTVS